MQDETGTEAGNVYRLCERDTGGNGESESGVGSADVESRSGAGLGGTALGDGGGMGSARLGTGL